MMEHQVRAAAEQQKDYMVKMRRFFHSNPEVSMQETHTTAAIAEELKKMGIPFRLTKPTGLVAEICGRTGGGTVALRADMDALTIAEKTGLPFASQNEGIMHACGHDGHMAGLLGAARILNEMKSQFCGVVRLIFQPGEEVGMGAKTMMEQGAMENADAVFGMHNMPQMPCGAIAGGAGPVFSAADHFKIIIKGKAGHGATPEVTVDATVAAAALVMNLQPLVSREVSSLDSLVVTVGQLHSGSRFNIISGEAVLEGTVRSFDPAIHDRIPGAMERVAKLTAQAYRAEAEVIYEKLVKPVVNEEKMTELCLNAAKKIVAEPSLVMQEGKQMIAEDFSEYMQAAPGAFFLYGVGGEHPLHSDYYTAEEDALVTSSAMYAQVALDTLAALKK